FRDDFSRMVVPTVWLHFWIFLAHVSGCRDTAGKGDVWPEGRAETEGVRNANGDRTRIGRRQCPRDFGLEIGNSLAEEDQESGETERRKCADRRSEGPTGERRERQIDELFGTNTENGDLEQDLLHQSSSCAQPRERSTADCQRS